MEYMNKLEKQDLRFRIYNRNKLSASIEYNLKEDKVTAVFETKLTYCFPRENAEWKDIEKFLQSRCCAKIDIPLLDYLKESHGRLVEDFIYLKFYKRKFYKKRK